MFNTQEQKNKDLVEKLKKEGYTDLGWSNEDVDFSNSDNSRIQPVQELNCSRYSNDEDHRVFIDHDFKEILHVDMSFV